MALYKSETYIAKNGTEYEIRVASAGQGSQEVSVFPGKEELDMGSNIPPETSAGFQEYHAVTGEEAYVQSIKETLDRLP